MLPFQTDIMSESLEILTRDMLKLNQGLNGLDGIKPSATETLIFEFDDKTKWNLTKNAVIVDAAKEQYEKGMRKLLAENKLIVGEEITDKNRDAAQNVKNLDEAAKDSPLKLEGILRVKLSALLNRRTAKDGKTQIVNQIPISVLKNLSYIIEDDTPAAA